MGYYHPSARNLFARICSLALLGLFLSVFSQHALAQSSRGTVSGLVLDSTKAPVANAKVDLTNQQTNVTRSTQTNDAGTYRFDAVDPSTAYVVKVSADGFKTFSVEAFPVGGGQTVAIDATLEVGAVTSTVEVSSSAALLQTEAPVRSTTLISQTLVALPIATQNPVSLALTAPGVSSNRFSFGQATFSVNGARGRSNNFLIDGTENNDISVAGQAFQITNPDVIQEVSIQTSNYDAEYGRAGGGIVNVITKSGTNEFHGAVRYLIDSTFDDAPTNLQKLDPNVLRRGHPLPGTDQFFSGAVGGPVIRNKTFFFSGYQEERQTSTSQVGLNTFSAAGRNTLRSLAPQGVNPRIDRLLAITAGTEANSQLNLINIGNGRPSVEVGTFQRAIPVKFRDRQLLERVDHSFSNNDQISARYLYDNSINPIGGQTNFPGFDTGNTNEVHSALVNETHTFSPAATNELRLGYNRINPFFPFDATSPLAATVPNTTIAGFAQSFGVPGTIPQGRIANNYELQDTISYVRGTHSFRIGTSLLSQRAKQAAPFNSRGSLTYNAAGGFSGLANYIDDFAGTAPATGNALRDFGNASYYPSLFRQAYFAQDRWRVTPDLTLTLGVRYEYFGVPINNAVRTSAFTGLFNVDPVTRQGPWNRSNFVNGDLNNWAPTIGIAYSPSSRGPLGMFGDKKTVFRAGFQMGYDSFFNNIASNALASAPNNVSTAFTSVVSSTSPRGTADLSTLLPTTPRALTPNDTQTLVYKNLTNPYYMRFSGGFQRELPGNIIVDASYVGSRGMDLFIQEDLNPIVPTSLQVFPAGFSRSNLPASWLNQRVDVLQGARNVRTNGGNSKYYSGQLNVSRRFANGVSFNAAYTRSKSLDNGSDIFVSTGNNLTSVAARPAIFGGQQLEQSVSLFDRPNRVAVRAIYELPFYRNQPGFTGRVLGGWQLSGVYIMESGVPLNILNGLDSDGLGGNTADRPNYNPDGSPGTRAQISSTSPTGYVNPDAGNAPIDPRQAMYVAVSCTSTTTACPSGNLGRFTSRFPRQNNLDATITKSISLTERFKLELRADAFNLFNHRQYGIASISPFDAGSTTIQANVTTSQAGRFLNPGFANGGARVLRYQLRFVF